MPNTPADPIYFLNKGDSVLDVGCNAGEHLIDCLSRGVETAFGVDINEDAVERAKKNLKSYPQAQIERASATEIPFPSQSVSLAYACEVMEHVPKDLRPKMVEEIHRVLKENGRWVLTVPFQSLTTPLDPENIRFYFPRSYRLVSRFVGGRAKDAGYEGKEHGVVRHHHFTLSELEGLLQPHFRIDKVRYRGGILFPLCSWLLFPFYRWQMYNNPIVKLLQRIQAFDFSMVYPKALAFNVLLTVSKVEQRATQVA